MKISGGFDPGCCGAFTPQRGILEATRMTETLHCGMFGPALLPLKSAVHGFFEEKKRLLGGGAKSIVSWITL